MHTYSVIKFLNMIMKDGIKKKELRKRKEKL